MQGAVELPSYPLRFVLCRLVFSVGVGPQPIARTAKNRGWLSSTTQPELDMIAVMAHYA